MILLISVFVQPITMAIVRTVAAIAFYDGCTGPAAPLGEIPSTSLPYTPSVSLPVPVSGGVGLRFRCSVLHRPFGSRLEQM